MDMERSWIIVLLVTSIVFDSTTYVAAVCSGSGSDPTISTYYSTKQSGLATYYGAYSNGGACSLDPTPFVGTNGMFSTVAIANNIWDNSGACGMCINMTATGTGSGASPLAGSYLVYVNNQCPSCADSGIDIGLSGDGAWGITWEAVPCPVASQNIQYLFAGSTDYYIKLQVRNTAYPVQSVSILQDSAWQALERTPDNYFTAGPSVTFPLSVPLSVQITSSTGDAVTDTIASIDNSVVIAGSVQFPLCGPSPPSTSSPKSSTSGTFSTGNPGTTGHALTTASIIPSSTTDSTSDKILTSLGTSTSCPSLSLVLLSLSLVLLLVAFLY